MIGICIFKEEYKETETKGEECRKRETWENPGDVYTQMNYGLALRSAMDSKEP